MMSFISIVSLFICLFAFSEKLSTGESGILKSPTITVLWMIFGFRCNRMSLMKLIVPVFSEYMLKDVKSCWWSFHLMNMKCSSLLLVLNFSFKSIL